MQFSRFLTGLFEQGRALVSPDDAIWDDAAFDILKETELTMRANLAGTPPEFELGAAQWAAEIIYYSCQALVCRHIGREKVQEHLRRPCPQKHSPVVIYSADLVLRYVPDVWQLAKRIAPDDPLVQELRRLGSEWPLSSVGIEGMEEVDTAAFQEEASLMTLYVDRIIARNDASRLKEAIVRTQTERAIGAHRDSFPKLIAHLSKTEHTL